MLVYIDMEHEQLHNVDPDLWQRSCTQFYPEAYDDRYQDGRQLIKNFLRIAGICE